MRNLTEELTAEDKAALWGGLMACDRIRVLGYARGGIDGKQGPINHIGLELWATFNPAKAVEITTGLGRDLLAEFAQSVKNAKSPSAPEPRRSFIGRYSRAEIWDFVQRLQPVKASEPAGLSVAAAMLEQLLAEQNAQSPSTQPPEAP